MTVEMLLELRPDLMETYDDALAVLRETWEGQNQPTEPQEVIRVLKLTLDRCNERGITYPRIFLLRKAQLRRGEFQPQTEVRTMPRPEAVRFTAASHPKIPQEWINQGIAQSVMDSKRFRKQRGEH